MHAFRKIVFVLLIAGFILACAITSTPTVAPNQPGVATIVASTMQSYTAVPNPNDVVYNNISLIIPPGIATNALTGTVPAITDEQQYGPWALAPEHVKILFDNYSPFTGFLNAELLVYPARDFSSISDMAKENIRKLQAIADKTAQPTSENMPAIPFFNAGQVIAAQIQAVSFKNGTGVRLVTQYDNGIVPISNNELFYHFQGLTSDGKYYIIAVLPTSADFLPADDTKYTIDSPTALDFPLFYKANPTGDDFKAYFQAVTDKLNTTPEENYKPSLRTLDALIQSITITP